MTTAESALDYESRGFSVVPVHTALPDGKCTCGRPGCKSPGKHPRGAWKNYQKARISIGDIEKAFKNGGNVGIVTGPISGIAVLDIDGVEGLEALTKAGFPFDSLPITPAVKTGGGGIHLYYKYPDKGEVKTASGVLDHVDVRGAGGFVVAPPSSHASGEMYEWVAGRSLDDVPMAEFDFNSLLPDPVEKKKRKSWYDAILPGVSKGDRNSAATRLAGRYLARGLTPDEVTNSLIGWNLNNDPPMTLDELNTIVDSVSKAESGSSPGLEWISDVLRINVVAIRRVTGDEPKIIMEFEPPGMCMLTSTQLLSPSTFQSLIADATKVVVGKKSAKTTPTHEQLIQAIFKESVDEDAGIEATWSGELRSILKDHVSSQMTIPDLAAEGAPASGPFKHKGKIWVSLLEVTLRSSIRWGVKVSNSPQIAQRLKMMGLEPKSFKAVDGSTRKVWGVDEEELK
jgi:hypothetical protein